MATTQLDRLRAALRYSSGEPKREIQRQINEICSGGAATPSVPLRWCSWCGDTLPLTVLGAYCNIDCRLAEQAAAENRFQGPPASEPRDPANEPATPEPPRSAPALAAPATLEAAPDPERLSGAQWWAAEGRLDRLHQLWEVDGWSAARIARDLGTTKNAVIGQVQRRRDLHQRGALKVRRVPSLHPLADLQAGECAWPQRAGDDTPLEDAPHPGAPDFTFCGKPVAPSTPYCANHNKRAWAKVKPGWTEERRDHMRALLIKRMRTGK